MRDTKTKVEETKTFTQEQVDELIEKKLSEARAQWDKEAEAQRQAEEEDKKLALMSDDERKTAEFEKREKAFETERQKYLSDKLEFEATKALAQENLPVSFARLLSGKDEEETAQNISMFKSEFLKAIEIAINERLKGKTPKTSSVAESNDPFLAGFGY
ncbi:MAG: DUF4355 domain-containing protein [Clostridia bacterium]|nr:DUF4355 domain-containing protein [Clostridia bacterium]